MPTDFVDYLVLNPNTLNRSESDKDDQDGGYVPDNK